MSVSYEDAFKITIAMLKESQCGNYGYDVYIPSQLRTYLRVHKKATDFEVDKGIREMAPVFYEVAWDLCRRGIIRPGVTTHGAQET